MLSLLAFNKMWFRCDVFVMKSHPYEKEWNVLPYTLLQYDYTLQMNQFTNIILDWKEIYINQLLILLSIKMECYVKELKCTIVFPTYIKEASTDTKEICKSLENVPIWESILYIGRILYISLWVCHGVNNKNKNYIILLW